jgi:hypothetical protein
MSLPLRKGLTMTIRALKWCQPNIRSVAVVQIKPTATNLLPRLCQSARDFLRKDDLSLESFELLEQKRSPQSFRKNTG